MQEYASRADAFGREFLRHLGLAFGSLAAAAVIGFPLGVLCHRLASLRGATLPVLSFLQTIPSLAMFGLMIPILGWVGANLPGARALGLRASALRPPFSHWCFIRCCPWSATRLRGSHPPRLRRLRPREAWG